MGIVHLGDCRAIMGLMADNSVDSIVTDPPYELGFMGKSWDNSGIAYDVEVWRECLRILKPGGYLVAFGGSRTYHRIACAIEDAGFIMRDGLQWIYGSGFPKSLDISKAIDKHGGRDVAWFGAWLREERERRGMKQKELARHFPSKTGGLTGCVSNWELGFNLPTVEQFNKLCDVLEVSFERIEKVKRKVIAQEQRTNIRVAPGQGESRDMVTYDITEPASDAAKEWQGYGTALKPAVEPIALAQKPLDGTYARNILTHGVGALNIDGCRLVEHGKPFGNGTARSGGIMGSSTERGAWESDQGRWPANILFGHSPDCADVCVEGCPVAALDAQSGVSGGNYRAPSARTRNNGIGLGTDDRRDGISSAPDNYGDTGGASRYFAQFRFEADDWFAPFYYTAKAGRKERDRGLQSLAWQPPSAHIVATGKGAQSPRAGAGRTSGGRNIHPTVKPVSVMRWLCRLVTPKGGLVFDPFTGSGTTYVATVREHLRFEGSELLPDHQEIAQMRGDYELTKGAQGSIFDMFNATGVE